MQGFRSGFKRAAGSGDKAKKSPFDRLIDIALWAAAAGALWLFIKRFFLEDGGG